MSDLDTAFNHLPMLTEAEVGYEIWQVHPQTGIRQMWANLSPMTKAMAETKHHRHIEEEKQTASWEHRDPNLNRFRVVEVTMSRKAVNL